MGHTSGESGQDSVQPLPAPNQSPTEEVDVAPAKSIKSPAFQFYPESWFSSSKVQRMSYTERGIYVDLLAFCWLENGLPSDIRVLASMLKIPKLRFDRMWTKGPLHECFFERGGKLFNARQERERKKQTDYRKTKQDAAHSRWSRNAHALQTAAPPNADAMPSVSVSVSVSDPVSKEQETSAEPPSDSTPTVVTFPTIGTAAKSWDLTQSRIDGWAQAYPNADVLGECRKALMWLEANPERRKTAKGMPSFLVNWLNRAVDRGGATRPAAAFGSKTSGNVEALRRFVARGQS